MPKRELPALGAAAVESTKYFDVVFFCVRSFAGFCVYEARRKLKNKRGGGGKGADDPISPGVLRAE